MDMVYFGANNNIYNVRFLQLLLVRIRCPRYHEERLRIMNSTEVLKELKTYEHLYKYLSTHTGMSIQDIDDVQSIYSTLKAEVYLFSISTILCVLGTFVKTYV